MTTMSMNTTRLAIFADRTASSPALRIPAVRGQAMSPVIDWCVEHVPGIAGRFGLALVPFSLLAWMFSV